MLYIYFYDATPVQSRAVSDVFSVEAGAEKADDNGCPVVTLWVMSLLRHLTAVVSCLLHRAFVAGDWISFKKGMQSDFFFKELG